MAKKQNALTQPESSSRTRTRSKRLGQQRVQRPAQHALPYFREPFHCA